MQAIKTFPTPCFMPNGLQWTDQGLFVIDQHTDNIYLLDQYGEVIRTIYTRNENGSGITIGDGYLWTASNGRTKSRPYRSWDTHLGYVYKLDLGTGCVVERFRTPDGDGIHGLEWDDGLLWITAFSPKALILVDPKDFRVIKHFPVELERLHGLARDGDGIWCAHTGDRLIVKYSVETGEEIDRIAMPSDGPRPHGVSIKDGELWYCDANFPDLDKQPAPEIGKIVR